MVEEAAGKSGKVIGGCSGVLPRSIPVAKSIRFSGALAKKGEEGITIDHLHKLNQKNVSAWNMMRLTNMARHGVLSTLDEQISRANQNEEDEMALQIRSENQAKIAAKKIFINVSKPGSRYITLIDLMRFMREEEAEKTLGGQDKQKVGRIALKNWVVEVYRERRALSLTLNDTKTAVNKLHHMVNAVVGIVLIIIWRLILGIATTHLLVFVSSQLLLVAFILGNTCKMIFEAIIFLFVMHPFDVGDCCEIDGVQMIVEEMNVLTAVYLRFPISSFFRCIENKEHCHPNPTVVLRDVKDMHRLKVSVWLSHRINH